MAVLRLTWYLDSLCNIHCFIQGECYMSLSSHASLCGQSAQTAKTLVFNLSDSILAWRLIRMAGLDFKCYWSSITISFEHTNWRRLNVFQKYMAIQQYKHLLKQLTLKIYYFQYTYVYICECVPIYLFMCFNLAAHGNYKVRFPSNHWRNSGK